MGGGGASADARRDGIGWDGMGFDDDATTRSHLPPRFDPVRRVRRVELREELELVDVALIRGRHGDDDDDDARRGGVVWSGSRGGPTDVTRFGARCCVATDRTDDRREPTRTNPNDDASVRRRIARDPTRASWRPRSRTRRLARTRCSRSRSVVARRESIDPSRRALTARCQCFDR